MRKAFIGAIGLLTFAIALLLSGCQKADNDTQTVKTSTVLLDPGQKLVSCGWRSHPNQVWYLTRPMAEGEAGTEYLYQNDDGTKLVIIKEEARRDMSSRGYRGMDMESIRQMRMEE